MANYFAEETVLRAAAAFESAVQFDVTPPLVRNA